MKGYSTEKKKNVSVLVEGKNRQSHFAYGSKNAEVILLDEPFSAMDAKMKSAVEHYLFTGKEF